MDESRIETFSPAMDSDLMLLLFHGCLMRAGGQLHFTPADIVEVSKNYGRVRMMVNRATCEITMTLITRREEEEGAHA